MCKCCCGGIFTFANKILNIPIENWCRGVFFRKYITAIGKSIITLMIVQFFKLKLIIFSAYSYAPRKSGVSSKALIVHEKRLYFYGVFRRPFTLVVVVF